jgi:hypothetical protein
VHKFLSGIAAKLKCESGVAMVEFALVLPLLLLLVLALTDFGKAFNCWVDETHLANEGARLAAVNCGGTGCPGGNLAQYIQSQGDSAELRSGGSQWLPSPARVCISFPNGTSNIGDPVQVTVNVDYHWLPFVAGDIGVTQATIAGTATMRLEATPTTFGAGCYP